MRCIDRSLAVQRRGDEEVAEENRQNIIFCVFLAVCSDPHRTSRHKLMLADFVRISQTSRWSDIDWLVKLGLFLLI